MTGRYASFSVLFVAFLSSSSLRYCSRVAINVGENVNSKCGESGPQYENRPQIMHAQNYGFENFFLV